MSQALMNRPAPRGARRDERSSITVMTCDVPVVRARRATRGTQRVDANVCRPSGRDRRRAGTAVVAPGRVSTEWETRDRFVMRTHGDVRTEAPTTASRRSNIEAVYRRRKVVGSIVLGAIMAGGVWILAILGGSYEAAADPSVPAATQVVHVRSGESLTDVARRIAPDLPAAGVVERLRAMNGLETSGLRVSQSLVAPAY